jgi:hypothetical protein
LAESAPAVEVRGETRCPRPDEVSAALGRVLGLASPGAGGDVAELHEEDGSFVVVVRRASGELVGEKRVPATLACSVRAEIAAVSIAALEAQLSGVDAAPLPPPVAPLPPPVAPLPPLVAPPAAAPTAAVPAPAPTVVRAWPELRDGAPARLEAEVGVAALASLNGTDVAPAGRIEVDIGRRGSAWDVGFAALAVGTHQIAVAPGQGAWWRWGGEVTLARRLEPWAGAHAEVGLGGALTAVHVSGRSFARDGGGTLLDPGVVARARLAPFPWRARPWLELVATAWPRPHELSVTGGAGTAKLPTAEVLLGLGFGLGPSFGGPR